jgi:hypothetical protein
LVLLDDDSASLRRFTITAEGTSEVRLETDWSSPGALAELLQHARDALPAEHYAVSLLGHGGTHDEVALDLGVPAGHSRWSSAAEVAKTLRDFREGLPRQQLDLVILQQCGRASAESLYLFRDVAPLLVASETYVGGPNTHYRAMLSAGAEASSGRSLAEAMLRSDEHAALLTLFDGALLSALPEHLDRLADVFAQRKGPLERPETRVPAFLFGDETTVDLCTTVRDLARVNGLSEDPTLISELAWFSRRLVLSQRSREVEYRSVVFPYVDPEWCGIGTLLPRDPPTREVLLHARTRWDDTLRRMEKASVVLGLPVVDGPGTVSSAVPRRPVLDVIRGTDSE